MCVRVCLNWVTFDTNIWLAAWFVSTLPGLSSKVKVTELKKIPFSATGAHWPYDVTFWLSIEFLNRAEVVSATSSDGFL